jgi:glycine cleavage system H protein
MRPTGEGRMATIRNCRLPDGLLYDVERDLWARVDGAELVIGLDDVGQTRAGDIQHVSFTRRALAGPVSAGDSLAILESAKWVGPVAAPFTGIVSAVNDDLRRRPKLINLDPYGRGWIVRLRRTEDGGPGIADSSSRPGWTSGAEALTAYESKLRLPFRSVSGVDEDFWCVHCTDWQA